MNYRYQPPTEPPPDDDDDDEVPLYEDYEESPEVRYQQYRQYLEESEPSDTGPGTPLWMKVAIGIGAVIIVASLVISMAGPVFFGSGSSEVPTQVEYQSADFVSVVDSATIVVALEGSQETVRLIGIERIMQPTWFENEVVRQMEQLLDGTAVSLEIADVDRDDDGNLLRYVVLSNGTLLNGLLVVNGVAYVGEAAPGNERYIARMRGWQEQARAENSGIWAQTPTQ